MGKDAQFRIEFDGKDASRAIDRFERRVKRLASAISGGLLKTFDESTKQSKRFAKNLIETIGGSRIVRAAARAGRRVGQRFVSGIQRGISATARKIRRIVTSLFSPLGIGIGAAAAGAGVLSAVKVFLSFDNTIRQIGATSSEAASRIGEIRSRIRDLAKSSPKSLSEVSAAYLELTRAGLTVDETFNSLPATLDFAIAGIVDMGEAARLSANTMKGFGAESTALPRIMNQIAAAANRSTTTVEQLATAVALGSSSMAELGQTSDVAATLGALLANIGRRGQVAGFSMEALTRELLKFNTKSAESRKILRLTGVSLTDLTHGGTSVLTMFKRLIVAMNEGRIEFDQIQKAFGEEGIRAFRAFRAEVRKNGIDSVDELNAAVKRSNGTLTRMVEIITGGLQGQLFEANSRLEELAVSLVGGKGLEDALIRIVKRFNKAVTALSNFAKASGGMIGIGKLLGTAIEEQMSNVGTTIIGTLEVLGRGFVAMGRTIGFEMGEIMAVMMGDTFVDSLPGTVRTVTDFFGITMSEAAIQAQKDLEARMSDPVARERSQNKKRRDAGVKSPAEIVADVAKGLKAIATQAGPASKKFGELFDQLWNAFFAPIEEQGGAKDIVEDVGDGVDDVANRAERATPKILSLWESFVEGARSAVTATDSLLTDIGRSKFFTNLGRNVATSVKGGLKNAFDSLIFGEKIDEEAEKAVEILKLLRAQVLDKDSNQNTLPLFAQLVDLGVSADSLTGLGTPPGVDAIDALIDNLKPDNSITGRVKNFFGEAFAGVGGTIRDAITTGLGDTTGDWLAGKLFGDGGDSSPLSFLSGVTNRVTNGFKSVFGSGGSLQTLLSGPLIQAGLFYLGFKVLGAPISRGLASVVEGVGSVLGVLGLGGRNNITTQEQYSVGSLRPGGVKDALLASGEFNTESLLSAETIRQFAPEFDPATDLLPGFTSFRVPLRGDGLGAANGGTGDDGSREPGFLDPFGDEATIGTTEAFNRIRGEITGDRFKGLDVFTDNFDGFLGFADFVEKNRDDFIADVIESIFGNRGEISLSDFNQSTAAQTVADRFTSIARTDFAGPTEEERMSAFLSGALNQVRTRFTFGQDQLHSSNPAGFGYAHQYLFNTDKPADFLRSIAGNSDVNYGVVQGRDRLISQITNRYRLPRFREGGAFDVGGSGGADSQFVGFMASPNERVTVETPAQQRASREVSVGEINVYAAPGQDPKAIADEVMSRIKRESARGKRVIFDTGVGRRRQT